MALADLRSRIVIEGADKAAADLKKLGNAGEQSLSQVSKAADKSAGSFDELTGATSRLGTGFRRAAGMAAEFRNAILAFAGLEAARKVAGVFGEVAGKITELRNTAKAAALKPGDVKVFQEVIEDTGESADGARQALTNLTDKIAEARIKAQGFNKDMATGVTVLKGAEGAGNAVVNVFRGGQDGKDFGVNVSRGGQAAAKSVEELTDKVLNNAAKFKDNQKAVQSVLEDLAKLRKQDAQLGSAVGVALLGRRYAQFAEALDRLGQGKAWEEVRKQLEAQGRLPSDESIRRVEEYNQAVDAVGDSLEKLKLAFAIPLFPQVSAGINQLATLIENFDQLSAKYNEFRNTVGLSAIEESIADPIRRGLTSALDGLRAFADSIPGPISASFKLLADLLQVTVNLITGDLSGALRAFGVLAQDVFNSVGGLVTAFGDGIKATISGLGSSFSWLWDQIKAAASAVGSLFSSAPAATAPITPAPKFADGGQVPGSGSGDTVPAWLTPGEFVVRRSVVSELGAPFFAMLNRGMGSHLPRTRFASGGLVAAGAAGGTPVHLHLGGHSFALSGAENVVGALVMEAHRHKIRSTGTKPSWFGGTPGGR